MLIRWKLFSATIIIENPVPHFELFRQLKSSICDFIQECKKKFWKTAACRWEKRKKMGSVARQSS
jgi:hypothetical protein